MRTATHPPAAIAAISPFIAAIAALTIRMIAFIAFAFTASLSLLVRRLFAAALAALRRYLRSLRRCLGRFLRRFYRLFCSFSGRFRIFHTSFRRFYRLFPFYPLFVESRLLHSSHFCPFIVRSCALVLAASLPLLYAFCTCFFLLHPRLFSQKF